MNTAEFKRLEELFDEAVALAPDQRHAYLEQACEDDTDLLALVERMLGRIGDDTGVLRAEVTAKSMTLDMSTPGEVVPTLNPGDRVGHYVIREAVGEGGFAIVYAADQTKPVKRRVALKIIKVGMDTRQVIARFEAERQALAMIDHAHVAKVFDAGATATGRLYFVMEYVAGTPITLKALEKDRDRRYQSASALAEDIRRYLNDEPIVARPPSVRYHFAKFAKRNKAAVVGAVAVLVALVAGTVVSVTLAIGQARARGLAVDAEQRAEDEAVTLEAVNTFLLRDLLEAASPAVAKGQPLTVEQVFRLAAERVGERFAARPLVEASIRVTIADVFLELGRYPEAVQSIRRAFELRQRELGLDNEQTLTAQTKLGLRPRPSWASPSRGRAISRKPSVLTPRPWHD